MMFLSEIQSKTGMSKEELLKICHENKIVVKTTFGSDGKLLGDSISDYDHEHLFWILNFPSTKNE